ncbi:hypothetical protein BDQ12DRAFT_704932 [Crucibulum laeve]|uniref:LYC1 C-terminal domain-containing protein n=1 Tax=Crucibulum laeve TaxID=68775 RepID=A0A5C3ME24_9AGAR|nr:hypothetical protein BDQ12DRAFT_704932 [Crucibulum laeve]
MFELDSLSLFPATPEQTIKARLQAAEEWGNEMSAEEFLERDAFIAQCEVATNGRMRQWILAPRNAPETLDFLCSCLTFRREAVVVLKSSTDNILDLASQEVTGYGVAGVVTPVRNRGNGYARHMMRLLHWIIASRDLLPSVFPEEWGAPPPATEGFGDGRFSVLWTDVGEKFYRGCGTLPGTSDGWTVAPYSTIVWDLHERRKSVHGPSLFWSWLDEIAVSEHWKADSQMIQEDLLSTAKSLSVSNEHIVFAFLPSKGLAEFPHKRAQLFWQKLSPSTLHWGIALKDSEPAGKIGKTFASWTLELYPGAPKTLFITRLRAQEHDFEDLMRAVIKYAEDIGMQSIEVWNLSSEFQNTAKHLGAKAVQRADTVPAFKWYGAESSYEVNWLANEKFCWCAS